MPAIAPVRTLVPARIAEAAAVLTAAFDDDPLALYVLPEPRARERVLRGSFVSQLNSTLRRYGTVLAAGEQSIEAAAVLLPPQHYPLSFARNLWLLLCSAANAAVWRAPLAAVSRTLQLSGRVSKLHLRAPHWHLATLGVAPSRQGRGVGTAVMQPVLETADAGRLPLFLETSKERNLDFYRRFGFEVADRIDVTPEGPTVWTMLRPPAG